MGCETSEAMQRGRRLPPWILAGVLTLGPGCATAVPYVGQGPTPQISRGRPCPPIDFLGNICGLPTKLLLWNWKVENHAISVPTERILRDYLADPHSHVEGAHFRLNEYAPFQDLARLVTNHCVAWPYRLLLGLPTTLISEVLLPGRIFGGLVSGDHYNPFTNTVSLYSDLPAVALHEAGHVHDFNEHRFKGTYASLRLLPFVDLHQESEATEEAIEYFANTRQYDQEIAAYKILYPAYGSYVGGYVGQLVPFGDLIAILIGHISGRNKAAARAAFYAQQEAAQSAMLRAALTAQK